MNGKENIKNVTCKSHTARSDRDIYKVSPSKLTRRELEDLYFSLVENNTQLKKTINTQRDQIKILSTKVQRMTVQKSSSGCQNRECYNTEAIVMEQKESIADLRKANERLSDRIRLLNMRLCSAKQFLRRNPARSSSRCAECCRTSTTSIKGSSANGAVVPIEVVPSETEIKASSTESCQQNKCLSAMEELREKIGTLEKELSTTQEQYSERMRKLKDEMISVREANVRERAHKINSDQRFEARDKEAGELLLKLRTAEAKCDDLATQVQIERSRVCELEMQVKASDISAQVAKALETHINTAITMVRNNSEITNSGFVPDKNITKSSDDSGYNDSKTQELETKKALLNTEANALDQIASLQAQLDTLKHSIKHNAGEIKTNANLNHLQNSKLDSNKAYGMVGASSSLSNDIFQTSRVKATEQIDLFPSTSRAPDVLMSSEDINKGAKSGTIALQKIDKYNSHNIYPMAGSLPVDMPKMPYLGENGNNTKILLNKHNDIQSNCFHDDKLDNENKSNHSSLKNYSNEKQTILLNEENKRNANIKSLDTNIDKDTKDSLLDDLMKKQSSLRGTNQDKSNKDLSVTNDENKIIVGSTQNFANIRDTLNKDVSHQGNDIGNIIHAPFKGDSDPSVELNIDERNMKKKFRYKNKELDNVSIEENHTKHLDEKICGTDYDTDNNVGMCTDIKNKLHNNDFFEKYAQASNASSKKDDSGGTYNVEAKPTKNKRTKEESVEILNGNHLDICQHQSRICTCQHAPRRDVALSRTCSGTLKFRTTSGTKTKFRQCRCSRDEKTDAVSRVYGKTHRLPGLLSPRPIETSTRQRTYNVAASEDVVRSTSPDNTDHEISSMTDLPNETEDKSPQDYISPGEERATSTLTESYAATTTDYGSLSEGELPVTEAQKKSYPDIEMRDKATDSIALSTTSYSMEEALRAISDELTRCRELLQGQLPSQEVCSRGKSLVLTWRFYNQAASMTRMLAGRVMNFDFSTEYDLKITDHFLNYLKHEEMPIVMCKLDKQYEPFVTCALPLRDALLNTNRRVDMSLALVYMLYRHNIMRNFTSKYTHNTRKCVIVYVTSCLILLGGTYLKTLR